MSFSTLTAADWTLESASESRLLRFFECEDEDATGTLGTDQPGTSNSDMLGGDPECVGGESVQRKSMELLLAANQKKTGKGDLLFVSACFSLAL